MTTMSPEQRRRGEVYRGTPWDSNYDDGYRRMPPPPPYYMGPRY